MIEINLSPTKKSGSITQIAGVDLSHINVKMMIIAMLILYIPGGFIEDFYDEKISSNDQRSQVLNRRLRKESSKVRAMANIQKQVDALNAQEKKLALKLNAVKQIISKRSNPFLFLDYITSNLPKDVWVTNISLEGRKLTLKGFSKNWKSIGSFLENLKNSIFFSKQISYTRPQGESNEFKGQRVEVYEIKTDIVRFK
jgi:Tfp pilus assembly protein PilN